MILAANFAISRPSGRDAAAGALRTTASARRRRRRRPGRGPARASAAAPAADGSRPRSGRTDQGSAGARGWGRAVRSSNLCITVCQQRDHGRIRSAGMSPPGGGARPEPLALDDAAPALAPRRRRRAGGWERDVGSVLYARDGTVHDHRPARRRRRRRSVGVPRRADGRGRARAWSALTASWHLRSAPAVAERHERGDPAAPRSRPATTRHARRRPRPSVRAPTREVAPGVEALARRRPRARARSLYRIAEHGVLVAGEVFYGAADGLRVGRGPVRSSRARTSTRWVRAARPPRPERSSCRRTAARAPDGPARRSATALARPPWRPFEGSG